MGKTMLSHALARVLGLSFNRIQFTSDVLPGDIVGVSMFDREQRVRFVPGPVFAQVMLADEINRATPKTQSALLEAMEENQVTVDGTTRPLPDPFFVIATQNPVTQTGTFPLPESQLDRFLMCMELGYPAPDAERELLRGGDRRDALATLPSGHRRNRIAGVAGCGRRPCASRIRSSITCNGWLRYSRQGREFAFGLLPRGALALLRAARAWAFLNERTHVVPEDVQAVLPCVVEHRLREGLPILRATAAARSRRSCCPASMWSADPSSRVE